MPILLWRTVAWLGILLTAITIAGDLTLARSPGLYGFTTYGTGTTDIVDTVTPGSAAAAAGLVHGDRMDLSPNTFINRVHQSTMNAPGDELPLDVTHAGQTRHVVLVARARSTEYGGGLIYAYETIRLVLIALAALIVLRRPDLRYARVLANFYIAFAFGFLTTAPWYDETVRATLAFVRPVLVGFAFASLATFSAIFPAPSATGIRRFVPRVATILAALSVVAFGLIIAVPLFTGFSPLDRFGGNALVNALVLALFTGSWLCVASGFAIGAREADPAERGRLRWLALSFAIGFGGMLPALALESAGVSESKWFLLPLTLVAIPIGSTYAILRHRLIDIGFVINRTIVFAIISGAIVLSFTLLEFVLGKYLVRIGNVQSSFLEAGLAIAVALSLGRIHERVDRFVDATFFRQRHLAELALHRLTREIAHMSDPELLGARVAAAVERHADVEFASIYLSDAEGMYRRKWIAPPVASEPQAVDENDSAIVRLKTFREALDLDDLSNEGAPSAIAGARAFPIIVRGELLGAMVCGAKRNGESLAPDERATLADLALATGIALDTLQTSALRRAVSRALSEEAGLETLREANAVFGLLPPSGNR